jgi:hypothetical protein
LRAVYAALQKKTCNAAVQHLYIRYRDTADDPQRGEYPMTKTPDMPKMVQDMMAAFPVDNAAFNNAFKTQAAMAEKMSKVALEAAEKSTEITSKWAKDTIAKASGMTTAKADPAEYSKAASDFASVAAEMAAENMAAFAEVAKKVQMETVELMLAAGKDMSEETSAAVKKATADVQTAAKKVASAAK